MKIRHYASRVACPVATPASDLPNSLFAFNHGHAAFLHHRTPLREPQAFRKKSLPLLEASSIKKKKV